MRAMDADEFCLVFLSSFGGHSIVFVAVCLPPLFLFDCCVAPPSSTSASSFMVISGRRIRGGVWLSARRILFGVGIVEGLGRDAGSPPIAGKEQAQRPEVPGQPQIDGRGDAGVEDCDGGFVGRWLQGGAREAGAAIAIDIAVCCLCLCV